MTSAYRGFEDLLGRDWATVRSRLDALAQRFVRRADDAEAIALHAIDQLDPRGYARDEAGARDATDALRAAVREAAAEALSAGATPSVPTSIDESTLAAFAVPSADRTTVSPVREALGALPQLHRDAVVARFVTGYRAGEVADALGVDQRTASTAIRAGRRALRAEVRAVVLDRAGGEHARLARSSTRSSRAHVAACTLCHEVRHPARAADVAARRRRRGAVTVAALAAAAIATIAVAIWDGGDTPSSVAGDLDLRVTPSSERAMPTVGASAASPIVDDARPSEVDAAPGWAATDGRATPAPAGASTESTTPADASTPAASSAPTSTPAPASPAAPAPVSTPSQTPVPADPDPTEPDGDPLPLPSSPLVPSLLPELPDLPGLPDLPELPILSMLEG